MSETKILKDNLKDILQPDNVKDIKDKRTEKLASALYLVSNFLSDNDPIKWRLRERAIDIFIFVSRDEPRSLSYINELLRLIDIAIYDRQSSPMNWSILRQEYILLQDSLKSQTPPPGLTFLIEPGRQASKRSSDSQNEPSHQSPGKTKKTLISKSDRQTAILEFLPVGTWASVKDIAKNLTGLSNKTVQRELNSLVAAGLIKKTGVRRWCRYGKG